jgi:alkane 1-monooxygenase
MKDLKYLTAYVVPIFCVIGLTNGGWWLYLTPLMIFGLVPLLELWMPSLQSNLDDEERESKLANKFFDVLLWFNVPIVFGVVLFGFSQYVSAGFELYEVIGSIISLAIVCGSLGINVAHELGHRQQSWERFLGKGLLLPSLYMHFYIEHNYGHHLHAATPEDPASARYNEGFYSFWGRSVSQQYLNAWSIQKRLNKQAGRSWIALKSDMFWYTVLQVAYLITIGLVFSWSTAGIALAVAVVSFSLLELVNYLEHYGLRRAKKKSGRYELVREVHSWNSNHALGRILLYELTRHSDHHYRASKKYQVLDYHKTSPQLPYGYPTMMVIALIPPLWFSLVNKHVPKEMVLLQTATV